MNDSDNLDHYAGLEVALKGNTLKPMERIHHGSGITMVATLQETFTEVAENTFLLPPATALCSCCPCHCPVHLPDSQISRTCQGWR